MELAFFDAMCRNKNFFDLIVRTCIQFGIQSDQPKKIMIAMYHLDRNLEGNQLCLELFGDKRGESFIYIDPDISEENQFSNCFPNELDLIQKIIDLPTTYPELFDSNSLKLSSIETNYLTMEIIPVINNGD